MTETEGFPPEPDDAPPAAAVLGQLNVTAALSVTPAEPVDEEDGDG